MRITTWAGLGQLVALYAWGTEDNAWLACVPHERMHSTAVPITCLFVKRDVVNGSVTGAKAYSSANLSTCCRSRIQGRLHAKLKLSHVVSFNHFWQQATCEGHRVPMVFHMSLHREHRSPISSSQTQSMCELHCSQRSQMVPCWDRHSKWMRGQRDGHPGHTRSHRHVKQQQHCQWICSEGWLSRRSLGSGQCWVAKMTLWSTHQGCGCSCC